MRGYCVILYILLLAIWINPQAHGYAQTALEYNIAEHLKDGLLVTGGEETRRHIATWTILVTLDVPVEESGLRGRLLHLRTMITDLHDTLRSTSVVKEAWLQRISDSKQTMLTGVSTSTTRIRRGLLNFVGIISNKLFGTATEAQVEECRRLLITASASNRKISHLFIKLTSVVNQTYDQVQENRNHLIKLENYVGQAADTVNKIVSKLQSQQEKISAMIGHSYIGQIVAVIESQHNQWLRQMDKYQRQRASLDLGWLTEEVLPFLNYRKLLHRENKLESMPHLSDGTMNIYVYNPCVQS